MSGHGCVPSGPPPSHCHATSSWPSPKLRPPQFSYAPFGSAGPTGHRNLLLPPISADPSVSLVAAIRPEVREPQRGLGDQPNGGDQPRPSERPQIWGYRRSDPDLADRGNSKLPRT